MGFPRRQKSGSAPGPARLGACLAWGLALCAAAVAVRAQSPDPAAPPGEGEPVVDVRVVGNEAVPLHKIAPHIRTRAGRVFDANQVEDDVRRLSKTRQFVNVTTTYQRVPEGVIVVFQVVERPTLRYVRYVGATLRRKTLDKHSGIKVGDAVDPYLVEEARRKIDEYYKSKGFARSRVTVVEGIKPGDRGAVFLINEGPKQKVFDVEFEGNTIADDGRLKTQIQSKPPMFYLFGGGVDYEQINGDVDRLTSYYRSLGFFGAKISHELEFGEDHQWATLRFVINEGPRYKVRSVSVVGAKQFPASELEAALQLKNGKYFDQGGMTRDVSYLQDKYGAIGFVYSNVQADPRFLETPGELDLVYQVEEGDRYRVGRIDVRIEGEVPHTRVNTVLNRIDLRPGDIVDTRKIRDSERRLQASGLFLSDRAQGIMPRITWQAPDGVETIASEPNPDGAARGQSPDGVVSSPTWHPQPGSGERTLVVTYREVPQTSSSETVTTDAGAAAPMVDPGEPVIEHDSQSSIPVEPEAAGIATASGATAATIPNSYEPVGAEASGVGNPFAAEPRRSTYLVAPPASESTAPTTEPLPEFRSAAWRAPEAEPEGLVVRGQSPAPGAFAGSSTLGTTAGAGQIGQVPLGAVAPGSTINNAYYQGAAPAAGVVPAQYTQPAQPGNVYTNVQPGLTPVPGTTFGAAPAPAVGPYAPPGTPVFGAPPSAGAAAPGYGSGPDLLGNPPQPYYAEPPTRDLILNPTVQEAQTGRFMLGVGINSNAGLLGNIVLDEQNADLMRWPTSFRDLVEGRAFRGAGQQVRLEAVPGNQVSRYTFIFRQPYLFDTRVQFSGSAYYFQRFYNDWREERTGGRVGLGYQLAHIPDLSFNGALRVENVDIRNPAVPTPASLAKVVGDSQLYVAEFAAVHDTRDNPFLATQGHRLSLGFDLGFGEFDFPRGTIDGRQHFLLGERPDGSGRQVLTLSSQVGFSGASTPIYENYFAGGFSSLRGFNFRGVGPRDLNVNVGGTFQWLNTVEYMFPLTADDMIRGVFFCDFGTVERRIEMHADNFRVAPGFGLRITVPAMGPAPIAIDFAVPVAHAPGDDIQNVAFYVGFGR